MDSKTLHVLEYPKVLERLRAFCDFSASMELAVALEPTDSYDLALARLAETSEARKLFSVQDIGVGGAHDIRPAVDLAARGGRKLEEVPDAIVDEVLAKVAPIFE